MPFIQLLILLLLIIVDEVNELFELVIRNRALPLLLCIHILQLNIQFRRLNKLIHYFSGDLLSQLIFIKFTSYDIYMKTHETT